MDLPGYRRRVLIEPAAGRVTAELEDDWHRMVVTLHHQSGVVTTATSEMLRAPWTTCPGAIERLRQTLEGEPLASLARRGEKTANCTHLYDLALFAAAHASDPAPTAYEVRVSDPTDECRYASVLCNGAPALAWTLERDRLRSPPELAGRRLTELGNWIATLDEAGQEAARLLRWTTIMSFGRQMDMPAGMSGEPFANGSCFTFQPERGRDARRVEGADRDFSRGATEPMHDRASAFSAGGSD